MKKNVLFLISLVAVAVLLFLYRATGLTAHIVVSLAGLILLVAYAVSTKKYWKCPVLEILERVFYGIALITGVIVMNAPVLTAVGIVHRISAALFVFLLIITEIHKAKK